MARKYSSDDANLNVGSIFTTRNRKYSDVNMLFEANPNTGDIYKVKDAGSVKQSVRNVILSNYFDKPFNSFFGSYLRTLLFENITPFTIQEAKSYIQNSIKNNESRAEVLSINISAKEYRNEITINIVFRVKETRQVEELNVTLERLR
jgi:phage baseplate assembly protein W